MAWVRLDDAFPEHPKVLAAGDEAAWLYVCALAYCNRHLTDGALPAAAVKRLTNHKRPILLAMRLVDVGLFDRTEDGFHVHDYLDYQSSKEAVEAERAAARERMAKVRERSQSVRPNVRPNIAKRSPYPKTSQPIHTEKTTDDDDSADTRHRSSSSVEQIIETTAKAIALKDRERPGRAFIAGIAKNLRSEQTTTVNDCITAGLPLREAAIRLGGDPWFVDKALNGSTP
jgi:hypothetical protein